MPSKPWESFPSDVDELGIQFLSLSGHKLHCPKGWPRSMSTGACAYTPWLRGSQENSRRGGTQNVSSIVGLGKAAELAASHLKENSCRAAKRCVTDLKRLSSNRCPGRELNGDKTKRLPNTSNIAFERIESEGALMLA